MNQIETQFNLILTGFMGTGKSTVGRLLAEALSYRFVDTDQMIEDEAGCTIAEIFENEGEARFRAMERDTARRLGGKYQLVISTGGRMMLDKENVNLLSNSGFIYCLTATPEEILRRVSAAGNIEERPLLAVPDPAARIQELLLARKEKYAAFPQIETENQTPEQVADLILAQYRAGDGG